MPDARNHDAHDYAERRPRRLQELREAAGFTKYGLAHESGGSRDYRWENRQFTDHARFTSINKVQLLDVPGDPAKDEVWR